jgi:hypothetical protein
MTKQPKQNQYYTTLQYQEYEDEYENSLRNKDDDKVFAKELVAGLNRDVREVNPTNTKYYIRFDGKNPHDPFPLYTINTDKRSYIDKVCKSTNTYKQVTKDIFDLYLTYLKTENPRYYKSVQRESQNLTR